MKVRALPILAILCGLVAPVARGPVWAAQVASHGMSHGAVQTHKTVTPQNRAKQMDRKGDGTDAPTVDDADTVLVLGSSVAAGWRDQLAGGGYLERAFAAISAIGTMKYNVINKAIPGQGVMHIVDKYPTWMKNNDPDIVVLAWGALDDAHDKTPMVDFRTQIRAQIQAAIDNHAVVFVITPPVSKASYTEYSADQANYLQNEMEVAQSFHSPNVHVFDVFDQMKTYLAQHNQTYMPYMSDGWHPNADGHILGAQLLTEDFFSDFGVKNVKFEANRNTTAPDSKKKAVQHS